MNRYQPWRQQGSRYYGPTKRELEGALERVGTAVRLLLRQPTPEDISRISSDIGDVARMVSGSRLGQVFADIEQAMAEVRTSVPFAGSLMDKVGLTGGTHTRMQRIFALMDEGKFMEARSMYVDMKMSEGQIPGTPPERGEPAYSGQEISSPEDWWNRKKRI